MSTLEITSNVKMCQRAKENTMVKNHVTNVNLTTALNSVPVRWRSSRCTCGLCPCVALGQEGLQAGVDGHEPLELRHLRQLRRIVLLVQRVDHPLQPDHLSLR